jgi:hypothetical protein
MPGYEADPPGPPEGVVSETGYAGDVPPEAGGRLRSPAFSSGLSINDFAACRHLGLQPVALVQGFCVMGWSWYGTGSPYGYYGGGYNRGYQGGAFGGVGGLGGYRGGYPGTAGGGIGGPFPGGGGGYGGGGRSRWGTTLTSYNCPHYYAGLDHRSWGENFEQRWIAAAWANGFNTAYQRMVEEAAEAGAHGIIGLVDTSTQLIDRSIREFHIYGTAVVVEGEPCPPAIWSSYLAGQRLAKLIEAGFMPTSVVAAMASVRVWAVCVTESLMRGGYPINSSTYTGSEITQISDAQMQARRLARDHVKSSLGPDTLHGADLEVGWRDVGEGDYEVDCVLRGTRVRRFKAADPLPPPDQTVRLT